MVPLPYHTVSFSISISIGFIYDLFDPTLMYLACFSVDGQYASQGKLGSAILGTHAAQDVSGSLISKQSDPILIFLNDTIY